MLFTIVISEMTTGRWLISSLPLGVLFLTVNESSAIVIVIFRKLVGAADVKVLQNLLALLFSMVEKPISAPSSAIIPILERLDE